MRKLCVIFKLLWIQKSVVAAATIWGNTVVLRSFLQICIIRSSIYSKASRYMASSCTDLDNERFWIGSKNFWDTRFLIIFNWEARIFDFFSQKFFRCTFFETWLLEMHGFLILSHLSLFLPQWSILIFKRFSLKHLHHYYHKIILGNITCKEEK